MSVNVVTVGGGVGIYACDDDGLPLLEVVLTVDDACQLATELVTAVVATTN
jgi:hypothetical protein